MTLALFDLDNTLLDGDSDQLWTEHLSACGIVDFSVHGPEMAAYHAQYLSGQLDVRAYLKYSLGLIRHLPIAELRRLRESFLGKMIRPRIHEPALALIDQHRRLGHRLIIITLTNLFVSEPVAAEFGIDTVLATEPEIVDGYLTGNIVGEPCYQHGKIAHLRKWIAASGESLDGSYFYSDSINDLPLLETVTYPVAINPDAQLADVARQRGWLSRQLFGSPEDRT